MLYVAENEVVSCVASGVDCLLPRDVSVLRWLSGLDGVGMLALVLLLLLHGSSGSVSLSFGDTTPGVWAGASLMTLYIGASLNLMKLPMNGIECLQSIKGYLI